MRQSLLLLCVTLVFTTRSAGTCYGQSAPEAIIAQWSFDSGLEGCKPLHDVQLSSDRGVLKVRCTGNDPHFIGPVAGRTAGWKKLVIRAQCPSRLNSQIFWTTQKDSGTSEARSVRFRMESRGKQWAETTVFFSTDSPLTQLRIDPHAGPIDLAIDSVTVLSSGPPPADPATDPAGFKMIPGFKAELLYSVPAAAQGSWVSMTVDPKGRLIVSDQYGSLYRVTPSRSESTVDEVESLDIKLGSAQGLLYAFDSLYVMVNRGKNNSGLYRVSSSQGNDQFDTIELLQSLTGALGEHGPHGIALAPDGKSLYVVAGNNTLLPDNIATYRLPKNWAEDQLLLRDPCSNGHNTGRLAPGGWVCKVSPDGKQWELVAAGFRNPYDIAFNSDGELFTYDADMEMDIGTPWYRPTRVCHVVSGGEYGWRWGTGKWPDWSPDSLPSVADIGMGSPTGVCFGYGAKFPEQYRSAFYVCDWTYGRLFAVHMHPKGATYGGQLEEFITGTPLPLTDVLINPVDHAMYFTIGGRRTQSGLYRVTYSGPQSALERRAEDPKAKRLRQVRRKLEALHGTANPSALDFITEHLGSEDRNVRYAARVALEHQNVESIRAAVQQGGSPDAVIGAALALARSNQPDQKERIVHALLSLDFQSLSNRQRVDLLRTLGVTFARHDRPATAETEPLAKELLRVYPSGHRALDHELTRMLVYLRTPEVVPVAVGLMDASVTQEDLLSYGMMLRVAENGWTDSLRKSYFSLLNKIESGAAKGDYVGGGHLQIYTQRFRDTAAESLEPTLAKQLDSIIHADLASSVPTGSPTPRKFIQNWKQEDLLPHLNRVESDRSYANGKNMFSVASCVQCHRFQNAGGILGPDITGAARRYSRAVMLREILQPSVQISDQFRTHVILTIDGQIYEGRIVNRSETELTVAADPKRPSSVVQIAVDDIEEMKPSQVSMMPTDLLNTLTLEDILDLLAYIESGGNPEHAVFQ